MNQEKIGLFIRKLREEKSLTQEELAKEVFRGRDAISKWERGKNLPDTETLLILSNVFNVSVNEILAGEKNTSKDITLSLYEDRDKLNKKIKKIITITLLIIFLSITGFLTYYFVNEYKAIHAYTITGQTDTFNIINGLFIKTNNKLYFSIGNITSYEDKEIEKIELYYIDNNEEKLICSRYSDEMLLTDFKGYEEYFDLKKIDHIIKNLYLKIQYESEVEIAKLTVVEDYVNDKLIFNEDNKASSFKNSNRTDNDLIEAIESKFTKIEDNFEYKLNEEGYEKTFTFLTINNSLVVTFSKENKIIEEFVYYLNAKSISYSNYKDSKLNYSFNYYNEEFQCDYGKCINYENKINEFLNMLEKVLF